MDGIHMHKLSTRCRNQHWEVLVPGANCEVWIQCKSIVDARRMSVSGNLAFDAFQGSRAGAKLPKPSMIAHTCSSTMIVTNERHGLPNMPSSCVANHRYSLTHIQTLINNLLRLAQVVVAI